MVTTVKISRKFVDELSEAFAQNHPIKPGETRLFFMRCSDNAIAVDLVYLSLRESNKSPQELTFVASNAFFVQNGDVYVGKGLRGDGDLPYEIQNDVVQTINNKIEEKKSSPDSARETIIL